VSRTVEALHGIRRSPVIVRTWCRSDDEVYKTQLAADTAAGALVFMETLTEMAYPLGKLDLVSVDAFDSGAMENWGLMLFRPAALLAGRAAGAAERYGVLSTVAHEVAHQWFGNQATCAWWDDLWLNEGFATLCAVWYAACGYDHATLKPAVFLTEALCPATSACPAWNVWVQWILRDGASALHDRAVVNTAAKVITDADIAAQFDGATYNRAAAVLRLVMLCMGVEAAIPALRVYLQTPVVTEDALWQCLGPAAQSAPAAASAAERLRRPLGPRPLAWAGQTPLPKTCCFACPR
jgi:aminopeptidase N